MQTRTCLKFRLSKRSAVVKLSLSGTPIDLAASQKALTFSRCGKGIGPVLMRRIELLLILFTSLHRTTPDLRHSCRGPSSFSPVTSLIHARATSSSLPVYCPSYAPGEMVLPAAASALSPLFIPAGACLLADACSLARIDMWLKSSWSSGPGANWEMRGTEKSVVGGNDWMRLSRSSSSGMWSVISEYSSKPLGTAGGSLRDSERGIPSG
mmetsp:Transcript_17822/g.58622  ORF Transcript_17822/g.58622 Transcript_17822/m.58622 type:complete len:210 (+) Transcript_17822:1288-1917(+)